MDCLQPPVTSSRGSKASGLHGRLHYQNIHIIKNKSSYKNHFKLLFSKYIKKKKKEKPNTNRLRGLTALACLSLYGDMIPNYWVSFSLCCQSKEPASAVKLGVLELMTQEFLVGSSIARRVCLQGRSHVHWACFQNHLSHMLGDCCAGTPDVA